MLPLRMLASTDLPIRPPEASAQSFPATELCCFMDCISRYHSGTIEQCANFSEVSRLDPMSFFADLSLFWECYLVDCSLVCNCEFLVRAKESRQVEDLNENAHSALSLAH